jgi:[acyl-carrier-protein] S-malonyltransferase
VMLPMSIPAHSSLMRPAMSALREQLTRVQISKPAIPVIHNADLLPHGEPQEIRHALEHQLYRPVRWADTIRLFAREGVTHVVECGPGKVLAGMVKRIDANLQSFALSDAQVFEQARRALAG